MWASQCLSGKISVCSAGDQVRSLHWEDSPEKKMATHSSIFTWEIPWTEEPGKLQSMDAGSQHEELRPWQRSWGRRLGIGKGGIEPQESPWKFYQASTPKTRVCLLSALCSHLHLWLYRGLSPTTSLWIRVKLQLQLIKFLGVTRVF